MKNNRKFVLDSGQFVLGEEYEKLFNKHIQTDPKFVQLVKNAFPDRWEKLKEELHADGVKIAGEDD
ncbi:MAG: hypothetical protein IK083_03715 [Abditibacteriota bacterium]|nr:hypothetical protein [Abditibacteriota bacterium]